MTTDVDEATAENSPQKQGDSRVRRLASSYRNGSPWVVTLLAFLCALVIGAILIVAADKPTRTSLGYFFQAPGDTFSNGWHAISGGYVALFEGSIFNPNSLYSNGGTAIFGPITTTLFNAAPLIIGGLSVGLAFRAGLFNIGGQGQLIIGAICAGYVGFAWHLPTGLHLIVALVAGTIGGALWGGLAGWLKARTGAHEVISTIMLNYIALYLLYYLLSVSGFQSNASNQAISRPVHASARLPQLFGSKLPVNLGIVIALVAAVGCWWLLTRSTLGFRLRAVGANQFAARTAGMSVTGSYITVMLMAGGLMGLVGCLQILGGSNHAITGDVDANLGFDAITVALLGQATPGGIVLAGLLFGAFRAGEVKMLVDTGIPNDVVQVIQYVIVLFIAAPGLIYSLFRLRDARGGGVSQLAKGWNG
ncbi:nucleoside ABC transporter membrane protein [Frankineae bacterium MT45]|nr:nucleoside ABC transporter membrane protein [Frankineae bacterium MT45]